MKMRERGAGKRSQGREEFQLSRYVQDCRGYWVGRGGLERGHREGRSSNCHSMYKIAGGIGWGEGGWKEVTGKGGVPIVTVCTRCNHWVTDRLIKTLVRGHREGRSSNCHGMYKIAGQCRGYWMGRGGLEEVTGKGRVPIVTVCTRWPGVLGGERGDGKKSQRREEFQLSPYVQDVIIG